MVNMLKQFVKRRPFLAIPLTMMTKILPGYRQYRKIVRRYGSTVSVLRTAWHGTGDYYICGMYLPAFLKENGISNYVFLVNKTGSERKVTRLFDVYQGHTVQLHSVEPLSRFSEFMRQKEPLCRSFEKSDHLTFIGEQLKGYRRLSLVDFYLWQGFGFSNEPQRAMPYFSKDINKIRRKMEANRLPLKKTVLLSPFSTCSKECLLPNTFWEKISAYLVRRGYVVATNCGGGEEPICGTIPLTVPYEELVPFLDMSGNFIGVRSGLCDILSLSSCNKIIIHLERSDFWPNGRSKEFVGIRLMGFDNVATEVVYDGEIYGLMRDIIGEISTWC